jgi:hypothetical protein
MHDELEEWLEVEGRELLRQMPQDHLDLRARRELRLVKVVGSATRHALAEVAGETTGRRRVADRTPAATSATTFLLPVLSRQLRWLRQGQQSSRFHNSAGRHRISNDVRHGSLQTRLPQ